MFNFICIVLAFGVLYLAMKISTFVKHHSASGEAVVSGSGTIDFELDFEPKKVVVIFIDDDVVVPCNPSTSDLSWSINNKHKHHHNHQKHYTILSITYNTSSRRSIGWAAFR